MGCLCDGILGNGVVISFLLECIRIGIIASLSLLWMAPCTLQAVLFLLHFRTIALTRAAGLSSSPDRTLCLWLALSKAMSALLNFNSRTLAYSNDDGMQSLL